MEASVRHLGSHYELGDLLGRGAMGEVYVARDVETGERLAAKVLRADHTDDDEVTARFLQERKLLRELTHPNIVRVRELVVDRDQLAIVMDLIDGEDARKRLRREGRLRPDEAVRICADILAALSMAHSLEPPVQHRDVKPDNILLGAEAEPRVYLTDFGVARLAEVGTSVKLTSGVGTADYMAPEMMGATAGSPADVYAVGITLYELLAGHTPFGKDSFQAVAMRHVTCVPPPIEGLPAQLWAEIEAMLVKSPASRPTAATAEARLRELLPSLADLPALPESPAPTQWQQTVGGFAAPAYETDLDEAERGTLLKGAPVPSAADLPVARLDSAIGLRRDGAGLDEGDNVTRLGVAEAQQRDLAAAAPAVVVPSHAAPRSRKVWVIVAAAAVALVVVVGGIVLATRGHHGSSSTAAGDGTDESQIPFGSQTATQVGGLGLTVTRTPSYDVSTQTLTMTIAISSPIPAAGPFFESVPGQNGGCGEPVWSATPDSAGGDSACGWQLDPPSGRLGSQPYTTSYTLAFPVQGAATNDAGVAKVRAAVTQFLQAEDQLTGKSLSNMAAAQPAYLAQRISDLDVSLPAGDVRANEPVPVVVEAVFAKGTFTTTPLYQNGSPTAYGQQLGVPITFQAGPAGCGPLNVGDAGRSPVVSSSTDTCDLEATVAGVLTGDSGKFRVR